MRRNLWRKADSVSDIKHFQLSSAVVEENRKLKRTNSTVAQVHGGGPGSADTEDPDVHPREPKRTSMRRLQFTSLRTKDPESPSPDSALDSIYSSCKISRTAGYLLDSLLDPPPTLEADGIDPVQYELDLAKWISKNFCQQSA